MDNQFIIDIQNLTISTPDNKMLVNDVSLKIPKGKVVGIVGESGSGKSLTMKHLMGILPENLNISQNAAFFEDKAIQQNDVLPISMIFQDPMTSLNPLRTVGYHLLEVIQRYQKIDKSNAQKVAIDMLEKVGISQPDARMNQYPFELSGGMRQRIMIAMALLAKPKVLIADEPTTALDVTIQQQILSLIFKLQQEMGLTVIIVSHDFGVIAGMCDEVVVMNGGKIVEKGSVQDIFYDARHIYTKKLLTLAQFDMQLSNEKISLEGDLISVSPTHQVRMEDANV